jgi:serine/threonine-protein kinase RsbT
VDRIPILKLRDLLLVTIQVDMHDRLAMQLQDELTTRISETGARGVLIDISSLDIVDSFIGRMIANIAAMARVLDAQTVVVGMQPAVAITLVELGLTLPGVRTALNVDKGMMLLESEAGRHRPEWSGMPTVRTETLDLRSSSDVVAVRQIVRTWSIEAGFSLVDQTKMVTAASELARNTVDYGGGGTVRLELMNEGIRRGLRVTFEDQGPGIPNIEKAMQDHYTSGNGLGLGLGGAKRLVNEFEIASRVGEGTRVAITRWK